MTDKTVGATTDPHTAGVRDLHTVYIDNITPNQTPDATWHETLSNTLKTVQGEVKVI